MKVTAIIDDGIIEKAMKYSNPSTITKALKTALKEHINSQKLKELSQKVKKNPLVFKNSYKDLRSTN